MMIAVAAGAAGAGADVAGVGPVRLCAPVPAHAVRPTAARNGNARHIRTTEQVGQQAHCHPSSTTLHLDSSSNRGVLRDLRYALRTLTKERGFTFAAILTLALGIGANTAIFGIVNAVLLRPLPYREPDRVVMLWSHWINWTRTWLSAPELVDYHDQIRSLEHVAAFGTTSFNLTGAGEPVRVRAAQVQAEIFAALGVQPIAGRVFTPDEDRPGRENVVMLTEGLWRSQFGSDASIVGRMIQLDATPYRVVGVLPAALRLPTDYASRSVTHVWVPLALVPVDPRQRGNHGLNALARLRPGVSLARAQAEVDTLTRSWQQTYPASYDREFGLTLVPAGVEVLGDIRPALFVLLLAVGAVLLIACANVANLLLARSEARQKELAIRAVLGAGRGRIAGQLLTESMLLSMIGGAAGIAVAYAVTHGLVALDPRHRSGCRHRPAAREHARRLEHRARRRSADRAVESSRGLAGRDTGIFRSARHAAARRAHVHRRGPRRHASGHRHQRDDGATLLARPKSARSAPDDGAERSVDRRRGRRRRRASSRARRTGAGGDVPSPHAVPLRRHDRSRGVDDDVCGAHGCRSARGDELRPRGHRRGRSRPRHLGRRDDESGRGRRDIRSAAEHAAVPAARRSGARARHGRRLRRRRVFGDAEDARDRRPHGDWRAVARRGAHGARRRRAHGGCRRRHRIGDCARRGAADSRSAVRGERHRSAHVRGRRRRTSGPHAAGELRARTPRNARGSDDRSAWGMNNSKSEVGRLKFEG